MNIAVVDANALGYMAHYSTSQMNRSDGTPVGIIWGFFNQLKTIVEQTECVHLVFAWDSQESERKKLFPQYKEGRAAKREEDPTIYDSFFQFDELYNDILPRLGFVNNFKFAGFEGDDLMAQVCDQYAGEHKITLVSNDQDLYQLLGRHVQMYKPTKGEMYTASMFRNEFGGLCPAKWVHVKAIGGCSGDGVPGIRGVGVKTCVKYLMDNTNTAKIDTPEGKAILKRNWPLVCLPFDGTPSIELSFPKMNYQLWKEFCMEYEFQKFLKQADFWKGLFAYEPPLGYFSAPKQKHRAWSR